VTFNCAAFPAGEKRRVDSRKSAERSNLWFRGTENQTGGSEEGKKGQLDAKADARMGTHDLKRDAGEAPASGKEVAKAAKVGEEEVG